MNADDSSWRRCAADVQACATREGRARTGCFSIEGLRLFERALRAGVEIERALVSQRLRHSCDIRESELIATLESSSCEIFTVPDEELRRLVGGRTFGDALGLVRIPAERKLDTLLELDDTAFVLVAVDVQEPGNAGALVRTAAASGARGLVAVGETDPFHPKAVRTSMGSLFRLPISICADHESLTRELDAARCSTIAAVSRGGESLAAADLGTGPFAILVGSEAHGLSSSVVERCDRRVSIPMADGIDSFSVHAAAAVVLYEVARRADDPAAGT